MSKKVIVSEAIFNPPTVIAYHSSPSKISTFVLDYLDKGNHEYGPGIYFTSIQDFSFGKYCYKVELSFKKVVPFHMPVSESEISKMIKNSPEFDDIYENFIDKWVDDENINKRNAFINMVQIMSSANSGIDQHLNVWADLYKYHPKVWVENMIKFFGYDGAWRPTFKNGIQHYVVYNPKIITIKEILINE